MCKVNYNFDKGKVVTGTTWGFNMWPSPGTFKETEFEPIFLKAITKIVKGVVEQISSRDLDEYSVNLRSKLGYPFYTADSKYETVLSYLAKCEPYYYGINTVLNRNQVDKKGKKRVSPCAIGFGDVNSSIVMEDDNDLNYKYKKEKYEEGDLRTMRMRLAFNFHIDTLMTLVADQPIHEVFLRDPLMHHDMSQINLSITVKTFANAEFVNNLDTLNKMEDETPIFIAADAIRFDDQQTRSRQEAYGRGVGPRYEQILQGLLDSPFLLEGTIYPNSVNITEKQNNEHLKINVPFESSNSLPYTKYVVGLPWYLKVFKEIQLGSGLSMVSGLAKAVFSTVNHLYYAYKKRKVQGDLTKQFLEELLKDLKYTTRTHNEWLAECGVIPCSYGDDQFWFGKARAVRNYFHFASNFINMELQEDPTFLGFHWIKGIGFSLTIDNYLKTFLFPEHEFGSTFRQYPAHSLKYKDLDYLRLSNMTSDDLRIFWERIEQITSFNKDEFVKSNLSKEEAEILKRGMELSIPFYKIQKPYLLTASEKESLGLARKIPIGILEKVFVFLKGRTI